MAQVELIPTTAELFTRIREDEQLIGATNGVNVTFVLPNSDKAVNQEPGVKVKVFYNGQRIHEGGANDFTIAESGGAGTGFDTVTLLFAPLPNDLISADYVRL